MGAKLCFSDNTFHRFVFCNFIISTETGLFMKAVRNIRSCVGRDITSIFDLGQAHVSKRIEDGFAGILITKFLFKDSENQQGDVAS